MAGVGTVSIDLEAKIANLQSDLGRAERELQKTMKSMRRQMEADSKAMSDAIGNVFKGFVGVGTAMFAINEVTNAVKGAIAEADKLNDMRLRFDVDAKSLMDLKFITAQTGTDMEVLGKGVQKLSKQMVAASEGGKSQAEMFKSLGVSVTGANGQLKTATEMLPELADKISQMENPTKRTALMLELFGKAGIEMTEFMTLGSKGIAELTDRARELTGGLNEVQLKKIMEDADGLNDHLGELQFSVQVMAMRIASELMPEFNRWIEAAIQWVSDGDNVKAITDAVAEAMGALGDLITGASDALEVLNSLLPQSSSDMDNLGGSTKDVTGVFGGLGSAVAFVNSLLGIVSNTIGGVVNGLTSMVSYATGVLNTLIGRGAAAQDYFNRSKGWSAMAGKNFAEIGDIFNDKYFTPLQEAADKKAAQQRLIASDPRFASFGTGIPDKPTGGGAGRGAGGGGKAKPIPKPKSSGKSGVDRAAEDLKRAREEISRDTNQWLFDLRTNGLEPFQAAYEKSLEEISKSAEKFKKSGVPASEIDAYIATMTKAAETKAEWARTEKLADVVGAGITKLQEETEALKLSNKELELRAGLKKISELDDAYFAKIGSSAEEISAARAKAVENYTAEFNKAFDAKEISKQAKDASDAWKNVWERAANEIGNIVSGVFNGSIRGFKDLIGAAKSLLSNLAGDIAGTFFQTNVKQPMMNWFKGMMSGDNSAQAPEWIGSLKKVFDGFAPKVKGVFDKIFPKGAGGASMAGMSPQMAGMMKMAPWMGAAMGGMWGLQRGGDGVLGKGGSLAAGIVGGAGLAAGGVAAYGALSAGAGLMGAASAGLAAIPVAGWIALGAIAVDKLSGGKLFGTSYKKESSAQGFNVSGMGADGFNSITESKQKALFGGKKYRTTTSGLDAQAEAQVDALFGTLMDAVNAAARQLGVDAPQALAASFKQEFDKDGKLTKETGTILGKTYAEAQDAFVSRMVGENMLNVAKAVGSSAEIDAIAEAFRGTGEQLQKFSAFMLAVQSDIKTGNQLWDKSAWTLTRITDAVKGLAQAGESVAEAYARTTGIAREYGALIGGIDSELRTSGLSDYQKSILQVEMQYRNTVKQAHALAKSLGLSGARTEDLTKIEMLRAQQMAQLQKQQTDQRDAFLTSLRLGDLSTLKDNEKLQLAQSAYDKALSGKDVAAAQDALQNLLEIGKRYYASGFDYKSLFDTNVAKFEGMSFEDTTLGDLADLLIALPENIARAIYEKAMEGDSLNLPILPLDTANTSGLDSANAGLVLDRNSDTALLTEIRDVLRDGRRDQGMSELRMALQ